MAQERKTKAVVYKNAVFGTATATGAVASTTLKQALSLALARHPFIGDRREPLGPADESPQWRLVGQYRVEADMLFGVLMTYMPGTASLFFVDDNAATSLTVEQFMAPATDDGKRRERLDGTLFFAVLGNHCVLMQSASVRERHFEAHLHWLLGLADDGDVDRPRLVDHLPRRARQAVEARGVREVEIGGALWTPAGTGPAPSTGPEAAAVDASPSVSASHGRGSRPALRPTAAALGQQASVTPPSRPMLAALRALLAPDAAARLDLEALAGSNIEYTLKVRYRGSTHDRGQQLMNTLGAVFRDAEGVDARVHLVGGGSIDGSEMRLAGTVRITTIDGVPDPDEVFEATRLAAREGERRRDHRVIVAALARPRRVTHALLLATGATASWMAYERLSIGLLAWASSLAGPFCLLCATTVWSLRDKADAALAADHLGARDYRLHRDAAQRLRARFLSRAVWLSMCALMAAGPALASQLSHGVWQWMAIASGAATGEAAYGFLLAHAWNEQLRLAREADVARTRADQEHAALVDALEAAALARAAGRSNPDEPFAGWRGPSGTLKPHDR